MKGKEKMEDEKIKQLQKQFNKLYLDTTKHCLDIEKWINSGKRKQGDIRRSLNRLTKKYEGLCELIKELGKNNITEKEALNNILNDKCIGDLSKIKGRIKTLYELAGLSKQKKSMYGDDIEIVEDILSKVHTNPKKQIEFINDDRDFVIGVPEETETEERNQMKVKYSDSDLVISELEETEIESSEQMGSMYDDMGFIFNTPEDKSESSKRMESMHGNVELANDIQNSKENRLLFSLEKLKEKSLTIKVKEKFGKVKEKIKNIASSFKSSRQEKVKPKKHLTKRIAALAMASTMAFFSGITVGESTPKSDTNNNKAYTDTNNVKNDFKDSILIQALENTEETKTTVDAIENTHNIESMQKSTKIPEKNSEEQESKEGIEKVDEEELFLVRANTQYTEVSDGSGNSGYFTKDTKVKIYNRALIKTTEDGSKNILKVTKIGQTWEQFAEEKGIDYKEFKEYIENNENIQECVSIQSEDGKTLYGWLSTDELERTEEMER